MIAKANLHADSQKLAAYLITGKGGERAELVELRDFASSDIFEAFADVDIHNERTDCEKPFFHCYVRLPEGEELFRTQWAYVADRLEQRLGFEGQGRAVAFHHQQNGDTHMHIAWSRIDTEKWKAVDPGLYKNKLKEICRELELELGLTRVGSERGDGQKTLAPDRKEFEQSRRLGTDIKAIRETIRDCWDRSDNGRSFEAALAERGYILARGDKRDFVVIDNAGGDHALGKRITGVSAAETRARLGDISKEHLPSVDEAKQHIALQAERKAAAKEAKPSSRPEPKQEFEAAARRTTESAAPGQDRAADNADRPKPTDAAIAAEAERAALEDRQQPDYSARRETRAGRREPSGGPRNDREAEETIEAWAERHHAQAERAAELDDLEDSAEATADTGSKAVDGVFGGLAKQAEKLLSGIFSILAPEPKLTPEQAELAERAAAEQDDARARAAAEERERAAQIRDIIDQDRKRRQDEDERAGRQHDGGRERERERDRF